MCFRAYEPVWQTMWAYLKPLHRVSVKLWGMGGCIQWQTGRWPHSSEWTPLREVYGRGHNCSITLSALTCTFMTEPLADCRIMLNKFRFCFPHPAERLSESLAKQQESQQRFYFYTNPTIIYHIYQINHIYLYIWPFSWALVSLRLCSPCACLMNNKQISS